MNLLRPLLLVSICAALPACSTARSAGHTAPAPTPSTVAAADPDLARFFGNIKGTFVLLDAQTGRVVRHNPERAGTRFLPASTFKIPNSLIALETGIATGPDFALAWDSTVAPREAWWPGDWARDHTMRSALPASVVWYYQELARRTGPERMQGYVSRFDYGNREISGGIDQFWLTGGLRISPEEQVEFLRRFYFGELGVSERSTRIVKELLRHQYRHCHQRGRGGPPHDHESGPARAGVDRQGIGAHCAGPQRSRGATVGSCTPANAALPPLRRARPAPPAPPPSPAARSPASPSRAASSPR
jgi:beta-lactamase class D